MAGSETAVEKSFMERYFKGAAAGVLDDVKIFLKGFFIL
jgi:hypothetical protein